MAGGGGLAEIFDTLKGSLGSLSEEALDKELAIRAAGH